jgi:HlyD family secretion protein
MRIVYFVVSTLALLGCEAEVESVAPLYDTAPVETRDIEVTVDAAGVIEPESTVEVKSKASGEVLAVHAQTGDVVQAGHLLVEIDKRTPRNRLAETEAALVASRARRQIAETQMRRAETLFKSKTLTQAEFEQTQLEFANAESQVVSTQVAVENARITLEDTDVRAPITGTVIEKAVEPGIVITSPTQAVSGGTVLMKMADLSSVQVRTRVDETDIGKIVPGMPTRVTVAAYPNQPFDGEVLKIEPQAIVEQNVTMFAVLITIANRSGLLKPGMNAEVEIKIASRVGVAAVPTTALRADSDIDITAAMLGVDAGTLRSQLQPPAASGGAMAAPASTGTISLNGREIKLPEGVDPQQISALMAKRRSGGELTEEERALMRRVMQQAGFTAGGGPGAGSGGGRRQGERSGGGGSGPPPGGGGFIGPGGPPFLFGGGNAAPSARSESILDYQFGGDYWVLVLRDDKPVPVPVRAGLTDLEYSEIVSGLNPDDRVLLLPSTSLYEQQERLQRFITERFGSTTPFSQRQPQVPRQFR